MWYYSINDKEHGPVSEQYLEFLLKGREMTPQTLVRRQNTEGWLPLEHTELAARFGIPQPAEDVWHTCAYSGEKTCISEMELIHDFWVAKAYRDDAETFVRHGGRLPKSGDGYQPPGNLRLTHLFAKAWALCWACALPAITVYLLICLPSIGLFRLLVTQITASPLNPAWLNMVMLFVVAGAFNALPSAIILCLFAQYSRCKKVQFLPAMTSGFRLWAGMTLVSVLLPGFSFSFDPSQGTFTPDGSQAAKTLPSPAPLPFDAMTLVSVITTILILIWFTQRTFVTSVAMVEGHRSPWKALKQSWKLTRGYSWATFGLALSLGILVELFSKILSRLLEWALHAALVDTAAASLWKTALPTWVQRCGHNALVDPLGVFTIYCLAVRFCYYQELSALYRLEEWLRREDEDVRRQLAALGEAANQAPD